MNAPARRTAWPWIMLGSRMALFLAMQGLIALVLRAAGTPDAWSKSSRWWIHTVLGANLVSIALLVWLLRQDGGRLADLLRFDRRTF